MRQIAATEGEDTKPDIIPIPTCHIAKEVRYPMGYREDVKVTTRSLILFHDSERSGPMGYPLMYMGEFIAPESPNTSRRVENLVQYISIYNDYDLLRDVVSLWFILCWIQNSRHDPIFEKDLTFDSGCQNPPLNLIQHCNSTS